jgi:hypothetical protein
VVRYVAPPAAVVPPVAPAAEPMPPLVRAEAPSGPAMANSLSAPPPSHVMGCETRAAKLRATLVPQVTVEGTSAWELTPEELAEVVSLAGTSIAESTTRKYNSHLALWMAYLLSVWGGEGLSRNPFMRNVPHRVQIARLSHYANFLSRTKKFSQVYCPPQSSHGL